MTTTDTDQDTTTEAVDALAMSGETQGAPEPTDTPVEPQEPQQDLPEIPNDADLSGALKKARKEAADRRVAAREAQEAAQAAQAERDALQARLSHVQDRWIAEKLYSTGVGIDAFRAAGYTGAAVMNDDGEIDADKFAKAVTDTAERFGRIGRPGGIVPTAGTGETRIAPEPDWAFVIKSA